MAKIEISPNFTLRPKNKFSSGHEIVSVQLEGYFDLHLDVICKSEHQQIRNPKPLATS